MNTRSLTIILAFTVILYSLNFPAPVKQAAAQDRPPDVYRSAPVLPGSKSTGQHRFRSARNYDDTLEYYKKLFKAGSSFQTTSEKIANNSEVRGIYFKNLASKPRWEGLNVYEHKGVVTIFVVLSDDELKKIAAESAPKTKQPGSGGAPKGNQKDGTSRSGHAP